jgi:hypothetical protein
MKKYTTTTTNNEDKVVLIMIEEHSRPDQASVAGFRISPIPDLNSACDSDA